MFRFLIKASRMVKSAIAVMILIGVVITALTGCGPAVPPAVSTFTPSPTYTRVPNIPQATATPPTVAVVPVPTTVSTATATPESALGGWHPLIGSAFAAVSEQPSYSTLVRSKHFSIDGELQGLQTYRVNYANTDQPETDWIASGVMEYTGTGQAVRFDSNWTSTCVKQVKPEAGSWNYQPHSSWNKAHNLGKFMPPLPFVSLRTEGLTWTVTLEGERDTVLSSSTFSNGMHIVVHIQHDTHLLEREEYVFGTDIASVVTYEYGKGTPFTVHADREDCKGRNST